MHIPIIFHSQCHAPDYTSFAHGPLSSVYRAPCVIVLFHQKRSFVTSLVVKSLTPLREHKLFLTKPTVSLTWLLSEVASCNTIFLHKMFKVYYWKENPGHMYAQCTSTRLYYAKCPWSYVKCQWSYAYFNKLELC